MYRYFLREPVKITSHGRRIGKSLKVVILTAAKQYKLQQRKHVYPLPRSHPYESFTVNALAAFIILSTDSFTVCDRHVSTIQLGSNCFIIMIKICEFASSIATVRMDVFVIKMHVWTKSLGLIDQPVIQFHISCTAALTYHFCLSSQMG